MEKILVTGGAGFIGGNLCRSLLERYEVVCMDDFSSGRRENISDLEERDNFQLIKHNVIEPVPDLKGLNYIFHLASRASPDDYQNYPLHTLLTNSWGTLNMLELSRVNNAGFLFASTSEVYGEPLEHPQNESYRGNVNPIGLRACYDESKRIGETLSFIYLRKYNLDVRVVRIFNTYGPGMKSDDGRVVSNFITQALKNKPLTVYGDGSQTRSFCYISDMVEGIEKAMFHEKTKGEVINLGNPEEFTVMELAQRVQELTASGSEIVFQNLPEDDPSRRNPDISKAKRLLNWNPQVGLEEGLKKTIEYLR
ncbi:MAG: UDP-glucuronic acid decarboxylase family protein [Candidatus Altiarchaeota archaeon]|nr:UDP-glucuronic acid decarboxylase family protein [Candidatus Altiarchaeota archaeon]